MDALLTMFVAEQTGETCLKQAQDIIIQCENNIFFNSNLVIAVDQHWRSGVSHMQCEASHVNGSQQMVEFGSSFARFVVGKLC